MKYFINNICKSINLYIEKHGFDETCEKLQEVIKNSGDAQDIFIFAKNVKGANIEKLEDAIIEKGNLEFICAFRYEVEGANIERLDSIIENMLERVSKYVKDRDNNKNVDKFMNDLTK